MSTVLRKPVFLVCDQVRFKSAYSATEASLSFEILDLPSVHVGILSRQQTTKALFRLRGCTSWSEPLIFAYGMNRFSHDRA